MTYGHAERTLATIRLLEAETRELLCGLGHLDPEHAQWLRDAAESASRRLRSANAATLADDQACVRVTAGRDRRLQTEPGASQLRIITPLGATRLPREATLSERDRGPGAGRDLSGIKEDVGHQRAPAHEPHARLRLTDPLERLVPGEQRDHSLAILSVGGPRH